MSQFSNLNNEMETGNHIKNMVSPQSQKNTRSFFNKVFPVLFLLYTANAEFSQAFSVNKNTATYETMMTSAITPPDNDLCSNATNLSFDSTVRGTLAGSTRTSSITYSEGSDKNDVFYKFTAIVDGDYTITFTKFKNSDDIDLHLYSSCGVATTSFPKLTGNGSTETITYYNLTAGTTFIVRIVDWSGTGGDFSINVRYTSPPAYPEKDYIRESKHFIFDIPITYLSGYITPANLQRWLSHLDAVYDGYAKLVGSVPCNGQKLSIIEASGTMYGWAWVYGGQPYINWNPNCITSELNRIDKFDDWSFGILHEMGHLFDKNSEPNWVFQPEITANLKVVYALDAIPGCKYDLGGKYSYTLQDAYDYFYNWTVQDDGDDDRFGDKITAAFINVARKYGWGVFTQAFKSYSDNSYPNASSMCGGAGKYNELVDRLQYFSGSKDIRSECFNTNNWLATIEKHYPTTPITTWQIGNPNSANVTAKFDNGTLSISGNGAMQDCYYNNSTLPWFCVKDKITNVVINNGITTIGNYVFLDCIAMSSITIPSTVSSIGQGVFTDNPSLTDIKVNWTAPISISDNVLSWGVSIPKIKLHVPVGTKSLYAAAPVWKNFIILEDATKINPIKADNIGLYSNPVKNELIIETSKLSSENEKVQIINFSGRVVITSQFSLSASQLKINVSHLPSGVYILRAGSYTSKFVKE